MESKKCGRCGAEKPAGEFHKQKSSRDGLQRIGASHARTNRDANGSLLTHPRSKRYEADTVSPDVPTSQTETGFVMQKERSSKRLQTETPMYANSAR